MKRFLSILILTYCSISGIFAQGVALKVASYNIRYDNNGDRQKGNGWEHRLPVITSLIHYQDFDVIGCQEVLVNQLADLKKALPDYDYAGVGRDDGKEKGEFAPIFYKKDKFNLLNSGVFWLSETPDKPSKGWDASLPRICTWTELEYKETNHKLWFFNLHLDHVGKQAREEACKLVLQKIRQMTDGAAVVLTGDFNVDQNNPIYSILNKSGELQDSYELAPVRYAWNGTFNAFDPQLWTESRIDHVFVNQQLEVKKYAVLLDTYRSPISDEDIKKGDFPSELSFKKYEARLPSDHFPVVVELIMYP